MIPTLFDSYIILVGGVLYFTKLEPEQEVLEQKVERKDVTSNFDSLKKENLEKIKKEAQKPKMLNRKEKQYKEHGDAPVLNVTNLKNGARFMGKDGELPVAEADWNNIQSLTFDGLKKIYRYRILLISKFSAYSHSKYFFPG